MPAKSHETRISKQQEAVIAILRAGGLIRRSVVGLLQGYGLTQSQFNVLRILRETSEGLPTMEIALRLLDKEPGITRLIDALEEDGLLKRTRSGEDRRRIDCSITRKGQRVLRDLDAPIDELDRRLLKDLSHQELEQLNRLLSRVRTL